MLGTSLHDMYVVIALLSYFQCANPVLRTCFKYVSPPTKLQRICDVRLQSVRVMDSRKMYMGVCGSEPTGLAYVLSLYT